MRKLAAFSKFLAYGVGGAETSTLALLADESRHGAGITLISVANASFLGRALPEIVVPNDWRRLFLEGTRLLARFSYAEYLLNRKRIARWFSQLSADELWTYGMWAPAAMEGFQGPITYFVRSETDLGIVGNYFQGVRYGLKSAYTLVESPAIQCFRRDLQRTIRNARVVANSHYMARRTRECLGVESKVLYPAVDIASFREKLALQDSSAQWVVFVGDNVYKGLDVILKVSQKLPDVPFRVFSRFVTRSRQQGNVLWTPWQEEAWRIYEGARLVIVPSQWEEAYGRIAREAYLLGIPVLVSEVGGLPEAVDYNDHCLVHNFRNPDAWKYAIRQTLAE